MRPLSILALALLLACRPAGAELAGTYEPHYTAPDGSSNPVTGTTLELRSDGRFKQEGFPTMEGTWRVADGHVVLQAEKKAGMTPAQAGLSAGKYEPVRLEVAAGVLAEPADASGGRTVWRRK